MDYITIEVFIWNLDNYSAITGLPNKKQQAHFVSTSFVKSAAIWIHNQKIV